MPRFFVNEKPVDSYVITGEDATHIGRSLRMRVGDEITLCCDGEDFLCKIEKFSEREVFCKVLSSEVSKTEPNVKLTLFQALPKGDKMELIIQKAVELGAVRIVPVVTQRCVCRPDEKSFAKKLLRFNKISESAAKQSGRGIIPEISGILTLKEAVEEMKKLDFSVICYEKGGVSLNEIGFTKNSSIGVFIGSEGGFEEKEVDFCTKNGIKAVGLGSRILRCETAPLATISIIMNLTENM